jgi:uncharacterized protein (DUF1800 family)
MRSRKLRFWLQIFSAGFVIFLLALPALAEEDADPNSPTPILMSGMDSTRAMATEAIKSWRGELPKPQTKAFGLYQKVVLFVTNVNLMEGEGANAFRVYVEDSQGRQYRFPVLELRQVKSEQMIYALTVELRDEYGFWEQPADNGDVLVGVTWRGLASNRLRLGLGKVGGEIKDDQPGDIPTPTKSAINKDFEDANNLGYVGYRWSGDRIRFLEQATFGPTQALDDRIRRIGLKTWLAEQFEMPYPSAANPYPNIPLNTINPPPTCDGDNSGLNGNPLDIPLTCFRDTYNMYPVQVWNYKEAFYGDAQLRHRVNWTLSQIWVIAAPDTQQSSWMIEYHQQISKNAFGNWRVLMEDMTLNPAMGNYLDMIRSTRTNPNENYAREVLQLFNVGLFMLNMDGTLQLDGLGNPIPTYDQNTVNNFTKVFTGWQTCEVTGPTCPDRSLNGPNYKDPMLLNNGALHDITAKTLFSYPGSTTTNIPACAGCTNAQIIAYGNTYMDQALDNIYNHPNVPPFISKLLIQHLATSDPTPAYVGRVAAVFAANRNNPTQMKEVIKAILLDPEARGDVKTDPRYGKLREPVQLATNLYRHFNVQSFDGTMQSDGDVDRLTNGMGQRSFYSPTVFNYYPADYMVPGTTLLAPEFGIFTTGTSIARANAVNNIVFNRIAVSLPNTPNGTSINLAEWQALAAADTSSNLLLDALNRKMMHGAMSPAMRGTIMTAVNAVVSTDPLLRARTAIYLIATSSQYQVQR